ncbi:response regulator [Solitalea lacus]|uniref:response regulator n=1 Tax=Solitalea lacus TaxID=2911172 RepID=UPI001EDA26AC|nr:response regulator [Solitalea lacus]UKJ07899.1 response regulator [Solitalea lacus]
MENNSFTFEKVMMIDDTEMHRYVASYFIKKHNFSREILEFGMATEALKFFEENQHNPDALPQVILLDIRMPEMDGFQFLEHLKLLPSIAKELICIVLLSSTLDPQDQARAEQNEIVKAFMGKPLDEAKLQEIHRLYKETFPVTVFV